eukprot:gnl/TRDRNA2_/TRDRNA2_178835_c0_seq1.p2 gnl/TRDRNA2_/TRDRNA2_178835_c0~~gnl/TRDRNA2_/TRDRNA2_178835_c0_seq1.p2  ORF type:complete len:153 (-),score=30.57 gnl/TRDRNA2_/TRDRNA2_178835_c0_seq1:79-498(-)
MLQQAVRLGARQAAKRPAITCAFRPVPVATTRAFGDVVPSKGGPVYSEGTKVDDSLPGFLRKASGPKMMDIATKPWLGDKVNTTGMTQEQIDLFYKKPFEGASVTEPDMPYIEEPSMFYMTVMMATPLVIMFWFLTKFV